MWDGNRQLQEQTDTHVFTTIYEQDSFEPIARLVWLKADLLKSANDEIRNTKREAWQDAPKLIPNIQVYHYHNDHLGTPNELTNTDGEVVWLADYEAWGNTAKVVWREEKLGQLQVTADELQPLRFQGQSFDTETGLHYNRFRYFDPDLGMFVSRDPIGLMGGFNVFQYAPNPTGWIDPWGLVRVGRWMNEVEYSEMIRTNRVVESVTGTTHVAIPANIDAFSKQAKNNAMYVEFDVPDSSVRVTNANDGWGSIKGPNSLDGRLAEKKGLPVPEMPEISIVEVKARKINGKVNCSC